MAERLKPTQEHQVRTYLFVAPEQNKPAIVPRISGHTPRELRSHIQYVRQMLTERGLPREQGRNQPLTDIIQMGIEDCLRERSGRTRKEAHTLRKLNQSERAGAVIDFFISGLTSLPGVQDPKLIRMSDGEPAISLGLGSEDLLDRLPLSLVGVPIEFRVV